MLKIISSSPFNVKSFLASKSPHLASAKRSTLSIEPIFLILSLKTPALKPASTSTFTPFILNSIACFCPSNVYSASYAPSSKSIGTENSNCRTFSAPGSKNSDRPWLYKSLNLKSILHEPPASPLFEALNLNLAFSPALKTAPSLSKHAALISAQGPGGSSPKSLT